MRLLMILMLSGSLFAQDSFWDAVSEGKLVFDARFRMEFVDQDNLSDDAEAMTLRSRLGYKTAPWRGVTLYADFENIVALDEDSYNSTTNGVGDHPVVADPETTELNQAYVNYKSGKNNFRVGRQRIILDNARFVGNVGWRQNEQTFDAVMYQFKPKKNVAISAAYLHNVNRIFGDDHPAGDFYLNSYVAHAKWSKTPVGNVAAFAYLFGNEDVPAGSHKNIGVRIDGAWKVNDNLSMVHDLSYADQSSYKDGNDNIDASYLSLKWGPKFGAFNAAVGYEVLGGDGTFGFMTPFATLHAFNGWADKFLGTPANGLVDTYLSLGWAKKGWKLLGMYHDFQSDEGSTDYGTELDLLVARKINKRWSVGLKAAGYSADAHSVDTQKIWAWGQLKL